jgi:hypothetical protein
MYAAAARKEIVEILYTTMRGTTWDSTTKAFPRPADMVELP